MSRQRPSSGRQQARQRERVRARDQARRRAARHQRRPGRRIGLGAAVLVVVAVVGTAVGLHVAHGGGRAAATNTAAVGGLPAIGSRAPNLGFTTLDGTSATVASLRGHSTLLWFVATWCSSCEAGTQFMGQQGITALASAGVRVEEVEMYQDLGQSGPSISQFGRSLAGPQFTNPDWAFGTASQAMTQYYNPKAYLDIYYLLDPNGYVRYVNAGPASTFSSLMGAVAAASTLTLPPPPLLAPATNGATGAAVDGISCLGNEQIAFHHHTHLAIYVDGQPRTVPYGIGIVSPQVQQSPEGPFVTGGSCFYFLHTHTEDGIIHVESPAARTYTLGQFFDEWGQPLGPDQVGPARGTVFAYFDGKAWTGDPRAIPVSDELGLIQLDVGTNVAPQAFHFPPGY